MYCDCFSWILRKQCSWFKVKPEHFQFFLYGAGLDWSLAAYRLQDWKSVVKDHSVLSLWSTPVYRLHVWFIFFVFNTGVESTEYFSKSTYDSISVEFDAVYNINVDA